MRRSNEFEAVDGLRLLFDGAIVVDSTAVMAEALFDAYRRQGTSFVDALSGSLDIWLAVATDGARVVAAPARLIVS